MTLSAGDKNPCLTIATNDSRWIQPNRRLTGRHMPAPVRFMFAKSFASLGQKYFERWSAHVG